jgi:hypothetical protein|tara:strand:+ start:14263 stop:14829 length:567 start_codon:yes stop_codon:yes gene_type:complete
MAGYILMVSENRIKEATAINGNVDPDYLLPYVRISQRKYMEIKLGTKLYNKILELIKSGDISLVANADYKILLDDFIADCLVQWAFYECIPFLRYKVQNGNIYSKTSETGTALNQSEAQDLRQEVQNTAEFYQNRLIKYLCDNNSKYPEYTQNNCDDGVCPDTNSFYNNMNLETTLPTQTNRYKFNVN